MFMTGMRNEYSTTNKSTRGQDDYATVPAWLGIRDVVGTGLGSRPTCGAQVQERCRACQTGVTSHINPPSTSANTPIARQHGQNGCSSECLFQSS